MRTLRIVFSVLLLALASSAMAQVKLTMWSHWAAEKIKRDFVEDAIKRFEAANPGVKIDASWYEKTALYAALKTALRAGTAPDIFYAEPDQVEYMENALLLDLSPLNWSAIEPWAKEIWSYKGKPYGLPLEASTVELYYNKKLIADLGIKVPASLQLDSAAMLDLSKKSRSKNMTPMALGVGDRPFPGAYLAQEALLKKLGTQEYDNLLRGKLSWSDPRVVDTLKLIRSWTDAGLLPTTFTTLKLGEAHSYFHTNPGAVMFLNGSWYTSRAFNPPDKGGQPANFPLGIMKFPAIPGAACNECKTLSVQGSYVANAATKHPKEAIAFLNSMATPDVANRWLENVLVQTGIKADYAKVSGPYAGYFRELQATGDGSKYYFGAPVQIMQGKPKEVFTQVFNNAFPAGSISVEDAVKQMNAAFGK
ncbi:MAG: carbohydrate ABC transporter substrate-binding protein [Burkholderiaceae bacterium]|nr:carbohydrate ABC transporter substrate-binding protein [Burkholderiaceae bacterium]